MDDPDPIEPIENLQAEMNRKIDMSAAIGQLEPAESPLTQLAAGMYRSGAWTPPPPPSRLTRLRWWTRRTWWGARQRLAERIYPDY